MKKTVFVMVVAIWAANCLADENSDKIPFAKNFLKKERTENKKAENLYQQYIENGPTEETAHQISEFYNLRDQSQKLFGDAVFIEPFGHCYGYANLNASLWSFKLNGDQSEFNLQTIEKFTDLVNDELKTCIDQLKAVKQKKNKH